ncbi:MAG: hypothetical protein ACE5IK_00180 [Acidobacteriota bacterium]
MQPRDPSSYRSLEASELYCPRCKSSRPVRKRLLLVLPGGNKFEYRCASCGTSVGSQMDGDTSAFRTGGLITP